MSYQTTTGPAELASVPDFEQRVLGAVLYDNAALAEVNLPALFFGNPKHRHTWTAMQALAAEGAEVNTTSLVAYLRERSQLEQAGGSDYLSRLMVCTAATVQYDAQKVREAYIARKTAEGLANLVHAVARPGAAGRVLDDMQTLAEELHAELGGKQDLAALAITADDLLQLVIPPRRVLLEGVLLEGVLSLLIGAPGTGKTWLMLEQAVAIASGRDWCGKPTDKVRVGILELENERRDMQPRVGKVCDAMGLQGDERRAALRDIVMLTQNELGSRYSLVENERQVVRLIRQERLGVLFIDSLQRTHNGDELEEMPRLCTALESIARTTGVGVEVVHHENKAAADQRRQSRAGDLAATRGLGVLNDHAKVHMRFTDCPGSSTVRVLRWGKANLGRAPEPIYLEQTDPGPFRVTEKPLDNKARGEANREKVRELLEEAGAAGVPTAEVADKLKLTERTVRRHAKDLKATTREGRWYLETDEDRTEPGTDPGHVPSVPMLPLGDRGQTGAI